MIMSRPSLEEEAMQHKHQQRMHPSSQVRAYQRQTMHADPCSEASRAYRPICHAAGARPICDAAVTVPDAWRMAETRSYEPSRGS